MGKNWKVRGVTNQIDKPENNIDFNTIIKNKTENNMEFEPRTQEQNDEIENNNQSNDEPKPKTKGKAKAQEKNHVPKDVASIDPFLQQNINEKDYAKKNVKVVSTYGNSELPEQLIPITNVDITKGEQVSIFDDDVIIGLDGKSSLANGKSPKAPKAIKIPKPPKRETFVVNKAATEQPKKDQKRNAESFAHMLLGIYKFIVDMGKQYALLSEADLVKMCKKNNLPVEFLYEQIPVSEDGDSMSIKEYLDDYNAKLDKIADCGKEFEDSVWEPLVNVCIKRGWSLTDEQLLMYKGGEKLVLLAVTAIQGRMQISGMIKGFAQMLHSQQNIVNQQNFQQASAPQTTSPNENTSESMNDFAKEAHQEAVANQEFHHAEDVDITAGISMKPKYGQSQKALEEEAIRFIPQSSEPDENTNTIDTEIISEADSQ